MDYGKVIKNNESLKLFTDSLGEFNQSFCDRMAAGDDFTIKLEVRGCKGELLHSKAENLGIKRPHGVEKIIEQIKKIGRL